MDEPRGLFTPAGEEAGHRDETPSGLTSDRVPGRHIPRDRKVGPGGRVKGLGLIGTECQSLMRMALGMHGVMVDVLLLPCLSFVKYINFMSWILYHHLKK